jgi:hypothetical protein
LKRCRKERRNEKGKSGYRWSGGAVDFDDVNSS